MNYKYYKYYNCLLRYYSFILIPIFDLYGEIINLYIEISILNNEEKFISSYCLIKGLVIINLLQFSI